MKHEPLPHWKRYEEIPYHIGGVIRVRKSFFKELLEDTKKLFKLIVRSKELVMGSVLLLGLLPPPQHVKAVTPYHPPTYIHTVSRLQPVTAFSVPVPEEVSPVPVPEPVAPPAPVAPVAAPTTMPGDAKSYALSIVGSSQFACLEPLWNKESGWNPYAVNSIGAMGIPQALGHGNVFALGDWKAQIDWGVNYISATYGTSCAAWAHSQAYNWY